LAAVIALLRPSLVLVQGDTLTAYCGRRARAPQQDARSCTSKPVCARRRSSDPFPEEWFRRRIARHAWYHFAPCLSAHMNLLAEGTPPERIHRVGNTGIDSLRTLLAHGALEVAPAIAPRTQVLVTLHRRENWDGEVPTSFATR
jgi:UDP-N-acetylglucosamine 2-epimerase (non-hydrolysing)